MASLKRWLDRRRNPWKAVFYDAYAKWRQDGQQAKMLRYDHLPADAVVLDFGGFEGMWTETVLSYAPTARVHVFEPHPRFAVALADRFDGRPNVHVEPFALGASDGTLRLSDAGDASSAVADHDMSFEAQVVGVERFFDEKSLPDIDLAKINIEGGEYALLPALIASGHIARIDRIQVQFHLFEPDLIAARDAIRADLSATHDCVWCYPFVWEEWRRKP